MNPLRKKRLIIILAILVGVGAAVALALSALQQNINLFYTPTQIANGEAPLDTRIRMLPVQTRLWRPLGIAHRAGPVERATQHVLDVLWQQKQV